jgi:hypothetical protein
MDLCPRIGVFEILVPVDRVSAEAKLNRKR